MDVDTDADSHQQAANPVLPLCTLTPGPEKDTSRTRPQTGQYLFGHAGPNGTGERAGKVENKVGDGKLPLGVENDTSEERADRDGQVDDVFGEEGEGRGKQRVSELREEDSAQDQAENLVAEGVWECVC
eukprot:769208-Rhodomonas_salina.2